MSKSSQEGLNGEMYNMQTGNVDEMTHEDGRASIHSVKRQLGINVPNNRRNNDDDLEVAIELVVDLNLSIQLARVQATFQQRNFALARNLVSHIMAVAEETDLKLQKYRCLYWIGILDERSEKPEDRARAFTSFWKAFPICHCNYVESRLLPLSLERYLGQIRIELDKEIYAKDRDDVWKELHEYINKAKWRLDFSNPYQTAVHSHPVGDTNRKDSRIIAWLQSTSEKDSPMRSSITVPKRSVRPEDLSLRLHIDTINERNQLLAHRDRDKSLDSQYIPGSPETMTPMDTVIAISVDPAKYDEHKKNRKERIRQKEEKERPYLSRHASNDAQQQDDISEAASIVTDVIEHDESAAQVQPETLSQLERQRSSLYAKLLKNVETDNEAENSVTKEDGNFEHTLLRRISGTGTGTAISKRTSEGPALLDVNDFGCVKLDNFESNATEETLHPQSDMGEQDLLVTSSNEIHTGQSSPLQASTTVASIENQKKSYSEHLWDRDTIGSNLGQNLISTLAGEIVTTNPTAIATQLREDMATTNSTIIPAKSSPTSVSTENLSDANPSSHYTRSTRGTSATFNAGTNSISSPASASASTKGSAEIVKASSLMIDHERFSEGFSRRSSQTSVTGHTISLSSQQASLSSRPEELWDALTPEKINQRLEIVTGKRRSSDTRLPSPIVAQPRRGSSEFNQAVHSPLLRRDSVISSPLRESTLPEQSP